MAGEIPENEAFTGKIIIEVAGETVQLSKPGDTLWWTNIAMERSTIFNGKIHYFYGDFQLLC